MPGSNYLSMSEAARHSTLPRPVHASVVWRWARKGIKARNGERVRLDHYRIGGRVYTTAADLEAFFSQLAAKDVAHFESCQVERHRDLCDATNDAKTPSVVARTGQIARANSELNQTGW